MSGPYDDILHLPHHTSATRPRMSAANRAAQFAPFAALTGYHAAIEETARLTDRRIELSETAAAILDRKLQILAEHLDHHPAVSVTYFRPDEKKDGGAYVTAAGALKKIDDHRGAIVLTDGKQIATRDILEIDCALFKNLL